MSGGVWVFDTETDNLLDEATTIHSLVLTNVDTEEMISCADQPGYKSIAYGLRVLAEADMVIGFNSTTFDVPVLQKLAGLTLNGEHRDLIVAARMAWPDISENDKKRVAMGKMPSHLVGWYSLEAFGYRLTNYKGDFHGPWDTWTKEMQDYCEQDVRVTLALWRKCGETVATWGLAEGLPWWNHDAILLEMAVALIVHRQQQYGFRLDIPRATELYGDLIQKRMDIEVKLQRAFPPWYREEEKKVAPRTINRKRPDLGVEVTVPQFSEKTGKPLKPYVGPLIEVVYEGNEYWKIERVEFNCNSRHHIADRLMKVWGWKPKEFTGDGHPKIDDEILGALPFPEAKLLAEFLMIQKRIGMLAEGEAAWLKMERNGRVHGRVTTVGTPTARMTHSTPNMAQVPAVKSPYGKECRALFTSSTGMTLVGCDADALELRDLAGYMARYDSGEYVKVVLEGNKDLGTDMHSVNARALGLDPKGLYPMDGKMQPGREVAKRWFYAFIYGAGDYKLGLILGEKKKKLATDRGAKSRASFLANLPALGAITKGVKKAARERGTLKGLDGRRLRVRSEHAALNVLLQSAGAIQMKRALVILDTKLQALGLVPGVDYEFVANVHDEWQIDVAEAHVETVKREAEQSIALAGEYYQFGCPLKGNAVHGKNWAETH